MKNDTIQKNIPDNWKKIRLEDICNLIMGQSPSSLAYNENKRGIPLIQGNNDIKKRRTIARVWTSDITKSADLGDIILTVRAPVGLVGLATEKVCIGRGVCSMKFKQKINKEFVFRFLEYFEKKWKKYEQGSTFTAVNSADIRKLKLNLPPLPEQKCIVAVLENWDQAIEKLAKKIEIKKNVKKGLMQNLLTGKVRLAEFEDEWMLVKLGDIGEIVTGNTPPMKDKNNYGETYCWATAEDFNGKYIKDTRIKLSDKGKGVSRFLPQGSILVTCIASIGKNAIARVPLATNQQINSIVINKKNNNEFIYYIIQNSKNLLKRFAGAGAMPILNKITFSKIKILIPKLEEQNAIAEILTIADKEIEVLEKKFSILRNQKKYLLNNLITGKIRIKE
jgi:type I restriction enzyme S subunit